MKQFSLRKNTLLLVLTAFVTTSYVASAHASEYGCTVLLCLANPKGPMKASGCKKPIKKLFKDLARGKSFPSCDLSSGPQGSAQPNPSWAESGVNRYDDCPKGTTALGSNVIAVEAGQELQLPPPFVVGIGSGNEVTKTQKSNGTWAEKICVGIGGESNGTTRTAVFRDRKTDQGPTIEPNTSRKQTKMSLSYKIETRKYDVYDRIETLKANEDANYIDVYIEGEKSNRVRF